MYQKPFRKTVRGLILFSFSAISGSFSAKAQLTISGQLRDRAEWRDGYGTLPSKTATPSAFISQRTRLIFHYTIPQLIFHVSVQDVRDWGQDASTISVADGARLSVHEAWAELRLWHKADSSLHYLGLKVGRQELVYDDQRLLGNLDWLPQARRHDALVLKLRQNTWQIDLGAAFNQNSDAVNYNGTYYTPANVLPYIKDSKGNLTATPAGFIPLVNAAGYSSPTGSPAVQATASTNGQNENYKSLQFVHIAKNIGQAKLSLLAVGDQFSRYANDSVRNIVGTDTGYVYGKQFNKEGVYGRFTMGAFLVVGRELQVTAGAYYQTGKDENGLTLSAYTTTAQVTYAPSRLSYTLGWDVLSGNSTSTATDHRFDPLYGTPHKFWGYMDYFYAGSGSPTGGLSDAYAKLKYSAKAFNMGLDYHYFSLASGGKDLGSEFDLITSYNVNRFTNLEVGLCTMAATSNMVYAKNLTPGTAHMNGYWAYVQLNIQPTFL